MYLFTALNQGNLIVTLNNEPEEAHERLAGNYTLAPNMVNEKKHWLQNGGTYDIWHCKSPTVWIIGSQSDIDSTTCKGWIHTIGDSTGPETATGWNYHKSGSWHVSNDTDVLVELGNIAVSSRFCLFSTN